MRTLFMTLSALMLIGVSIPSQAEEMHFLNCRLMTNSDPWLFRQHCKSDNFARLAVPELAVNDPWKKDHKKHAYKKKPYDKKKYAYKKDEQKLGYLKKKEYLAKLHSLEKKLYAEL